MLVQYFPGISSGVLCVIFGIYEKLLDSILHFFKNLKENTCFLLPLFMGIGLGIIIFSNFLQYFFETFPIQTNSIFIGLILETIPTLINTLNLEKNIKNKSKLLICIFSFTICFFIGIVSVIFENLLPISQIQYNNFLYLLFSGFLMSIGVVVPGVSSTIILMLLGVYSLYLNSVSSLSFNVLIPMGLGLILGGFTFMKIIKYLLDKFYIQTFSGIIGFTVGSIFVIFPSINSEIEFLLTFSCILLGFTIASFFQKRT